MKINRIIYQSRRDFTAVYECEGCGHQTDGSGYDDDNFHQRVIPRMRCEKCGKTSEECGADYRALTTKYPAGYQI